MNQHVRVFEDRPAVRESVPLLIGLFGNSGSGKTYSSLRVATGIQSVTGGDLFVIDTEARRALHYADKFKFRHLEFNPPFGSLDYLAAIRHCVDKGAKVVVIDSMTHEHLGEGGYLQTQEAELVRMADDDWSKRERVKMAAWIRPSALRQRMITGILQLNISLVFCFRAKEKIKPQRGTNGGKTEIIELGFMPIAGEELLFEMTVNCMLPPKSEGVPQWRSDQIGERLMMKLPEQFKTLFAQQQPLSEETGRYLAEWAKGGTATPVDIEPLKVLADEAASGGSDVLKTWWKGLSGAEQRAMKLLMDAANGYKERAAQADKDAEKRDAEIAAAEKGKKC